MINIGDNVLLSSKNITFKNLNTKKNPQIMRAFRITYFIGAVAYRLLLPDALKI